MTNNSLSTDSLPIHTATFAGFWIRLGAMIIDALILAPIYLLNHYNLFYLKSISLMLLIGILGALYKPYLEWKKSATFGKMALGIKLVDADMNNITLSQTFKRYIPWLIQVVIALFMNIQLFTNPEFQHIEEFMDIGILMQSSPLYWINSLYSFIFIFLIGSLIFNQQKQGVHDKYAATYCIVKKAEVSA